MKRAAGVVTERRFFATASAFRHWLDAHAAAASELLVGFHKVGTGQPSISWSASVDEALCFGWIDGLRKRVDEAMDSSRFTPRRPGSIWSAINIAKVEELRAEGRMTLAGTEAFAKRTEARSKVYAYEREEPAALSPAELRAFGREKAAWPAARVSRWRGSVVTSPSPCRSPRASMPRRPGLS